MEKMQIVVNDFEKLKAPYPIWSVVYVRTKDMAFPSERWTDATSSILVIWMNAACRLACGIANEIQLPFMDGDYFIKVEKIRNEVAFASCIAPNNNIEIYTQIDLMYFYRQMISAASKLKRHYPDHMQSYHILEVCAAADQLRAALRM